MADHPITPPPELVEEWLAEGSLGQDWERVHLNLATQAARWGADQELMACINWLYENGWGQAVDGLRAARRPKPKSLKEQALDRCNDYIDPDGIIRRALEALPDD